MSSLLCSGLSCREGRTNPSPTTTCTPEPRYHQVRLIYCALTDDSENITRKGLIRSLQDQVSSLQAEVLELRHENAALSRQISTLKKRGGDEATTQAIDMILLAVPALQRFRGLLADQAPKPKRRERIVVTAVGARQGAAAPPGLDTLGEEEEGEETPRRKGGKGRQSRSAPSTPSEGSPFVSPSPKRTPRRRRRRESGLFPPQPQLGSSPLPTADVAADADASAAPSNDQPSGWHEDADEDTVEAVVTPTARRKNSPKAKPLAKETPDSAASTTPKTTPKRRKSSPGCESPSHSRRLTAAASAASPTATSSPLTPISDSEPTRRALAPARSVSAATPLTSGPSDASSSSTPGSAPSTTPASSTPSAPSTSATTATPPSSALSLSATSAASEDDGPRSRRARSSVSYKEPSLRTKMRKPDGVSLDAAIVGVRRKSALPRSTAKPDLGRAAADIERELEKDAREREVEEWAREHGLEMIGDRHGRGKGSEAGEDGGEGEGKKGERKEGEKRSPRNSAAAPAPASAPTPVTQARPRTPSSAPKERASSKKTAATTKRRTLGAA